MAKHQLLRKQLHYTEQINMTNPQKHKTDANKTKTTEGRGKQSSFCFESNDAAGVVTFSWVQSSDRSVNRKNKTESREADLHNEEAEPVT